MVLDILSDVIDRESDMQIVGGCSEPEPLTECLQRVRPDVLIVGLDEGELSTVCGEVLSRFPHVKVLAIDGRAQHVTLYELRPARTVLGEVSPAELVARIRQAVQPMEIVTRSADGPGGPPSASALDLRLTLARQGGERGEAR